jgi:L-fuconolactonase
MPVESWSPPVRIDAHHHFWSYTCAEYGWIDDSMASIRRDFLPEDLAPEIRSCGVDGVISVQARQSLDETRWLQMLASQHNFIRAVVGWVPLIAPDIHDVLASMVTAGHLKGVRHVLQGEPDDLYMLRKDFNCGIDLLLEFGLAYDILIFERQLPQTIQFVDRHPLQVFVIDHIAKPRIRDHAVHPWRENLRSLADRPNVFCKLSGMVTEANYTNWTDEDLAPYFDVVLDSFGPNRLMFGSDWPVCLVATTYRSWLDFIGRRIASLSNEERDAILGRTAVNAYRLLP